MSRNSVTWAVSKALLMIYIPVIGMIPLSKSLFQYRSEDSVFKSEINICASMGSFIS